MERVHDHRENISNTTYLLNHSNSAILFVISSSFSKLLYVDGKMDG